MVQMLKVGKQLRDPAQLREVEVRDNEIFLRWHDSTYPTHLQGEEMKEFMAQVEPATVPRDKVIGLKEKAPPDKAAK